MKLRIITKRYRFTFWLPIWLLKRKFIWKRLLSNMPNTQVNYKTLVKPMYKAIKNYKKVHKQLILLDVQTSDGFVVQITL
ncbi:MAG: hypothetical protein FWE36_01760 [Erysipelotrichales bacterium]|nr:hypothetical protein [Erysipelotrichales bacterium]